MRFFCAKLDGPRVTPYPAPRHCAIDRFDGGNVNGDDLSRMPCTHLDHPVLLPRSFRSNLGRVSDPQLELQLGQQTLKPSRLSAGLHADADSDLLLFQNTIRTPPLPDDAPVCALATRQFPY